MTRKQTSSLIRSAILSFVAKQSEDVIGTIATKFTISRQAIHRYIKVLIANEYLTAKGATRNKQYFLGKKRYFMKQYLLTQLLEEHRIWERDVKYILHQLPENIDDIAYYGFTEMVNNAIDHSEGKTLTITFELIDNRLTLIVSDDGEGIFKRITRLEQLDDERLAILELSKGKLTTDPKNHTGQGIFFTSKVFDTFMIKSQGLTYTHFKNDEIDTLKTVSPIPNANTTVFMQINTNSKTLLKSVFDDYSHRSDDYEFNRTNVPVKLTNFEGGKLISRSQAKRLLANLDKFQYIVLDFDGIDFIGQAFADQIFRVFQQCHPKIEFTNINTAAKVANMIRGAIANRGIGVV